MAKYYAMINDRRCGPFTLEELADAGVRPDTYVWSRDLPDWTHADEVADICQFFRKRIADLKRPRPAELPAPSQETPEVQEETPERIWLHNLPEPEEDPADHDPSQPPPPMLLPLAIMVTLLCFPPTGIVAIYYAVKARKDWAEACRSDSRSSAQLYSDSERRDIREHMAACVRRSMMWTGISAFLGMIVYAAIARFW